MNSPSVKNDNISLNNNDDYILEKDYYRSKWEGVILGLGHGQGQTIGNDSSKGNKGAYDLSRWIESRGNNNSGSAGTASTTISDYAPPALAGESPSPLDKEGTIVNNVINSSIKVEITNVHNPSVEESTDALASMENKGKGKEEYLKVNKSNESLNSGTGSTAGTATSGTSDVSNELVAGKGDISTLIVNHLNYVVNSLPTIPIVNNHNLTPLKSVSFNQNVEVVTPSIIKRYESLRDLNNNMSNLNSSVNSQVSSSSASTSILGKGGKDVGASKSILNHSMLGQVRRGTFFTSDVNQLEWSWLSSFTNSQKMLIHQEELTLAIQNSSHTTTLPNNLIALYSLPNRESQWLGMTFIMDKYGDKDQRLWSLLDVSSAFKKYSQFLDTLDSFSNTPGLSINKAVFMKTSKEHLTMFMNLYDYLLVSNYGEFLTSELASGSVRDGGRATFTIMSNSPRFSNPINDLALIFNTKESLALHDFWHLHRHFNQEIIDYISNDNDLSFYIQSRSLEHNIFRSWVKEMREYVVYSNGRWVWKDVSALAAEQSVTLWVNLAKDLDWSSKILQKLADSPSAFSLKQSYPNRLTSDLFLPVQADTSENPKSAFTESSNNISTPIDSRVHTKSKSKSKSKVKVKVKFSEK